MSRPLQHAVPAPPLDAASTGTPDQRPVASGHQSNRCWIEAGLDVMPIGSVTLINGTARENARGPADLRGRRLDADHVAAHPDQAILSPSWLGACTQRPPV
jgi:hypothetical protein